MRRHGHSLPNQSATCTLMPGDLFCDRAPQFLGTVLGSCVSLCLWDQQLRFGGMNHYILPNCPSNEVPSPRFGDVAVPTLIERMISLGSTPRNLQAKLFGGAYVLRAGNPEYAVGRRNIEVALNQLRQHRIPIVASRLSGTQGLVIRQCTECGDVWVRPTGVSGAGRRVAVEVHELPCGTGDIAPALVICDEDGLPMAIRSRCSTPSAGRSCTTCLSSSSFGWRRT